MTNVAWKAIASGVAMILCGWATAYAQSRIGTAGAGAIAEKPEVAGMVVAMEALPELIAVLGFVTAAMMITQLK